MTHIVLYYVLGLLALVVVLQMMLARRKNGSAMLIHQAFSSLEETTAKNEKVLRDELAQTLTDVRGLREDMATQFSTLVSSMTPTIVFSQSIDQKLERIREGIEANLKTMQVEGDYKLDQIGQDAATIAKGQREDSAIVVRQMNENIAAILNPFAQDITQAVIDILKENMAQHAELLKENMAHHTEILRSSLAQHNSRAAHVGEQLKTLQDATEISFRDHRIEMDSRLRQIRAEAAIISKLSGAMQAFGVSLSNQPGKTMDGNHVGSR